MKKILVVVAALFGVVVLAVGGFAGFVAARGVPSFEAPKPRAYTVTSTPQQVLRGQKIASMLCIQCHQGPDGRLSGKQCVDFPAEFGQIYSRNITQDPVAGIGKWTDGQIIHFMRTGIRPDGQYRPVMPKFALMADADASAVVAWLRSSDAMVQPSQQEPAETQYNFLVKALSNTVMGPLPGPEAPILVPDSTNKVAFGRYVADGLVSCYACHSADFKKQDPLHPEKSEGYYGGGNQLLARDGKTVVPSANITFDEETGIGNKYSEATFVKAVKYCQGTNGQLLRYPMVPHSALSDYEVQAIYEYLETVPKLKHDVTGKAS